jgi:hypothetical protein
MRAGAGERHRTRQARDKETGCCGVDEAAVIYGGSVISDAETSRIVRPDSTRSGPGDGIQADMVSA